VVSLNFRLSRVLEKKRYIPPGCLDHSCHKQEDRTKIPNYISLLPHIKCQFSDQVLICLLNPKPQTYIPLHLTSALHTRQLWMEANVRSLEELNDRHSTYVKIPELPNAHLVRSQALGNPIVSST
jgi:hypothetical protein